jgi:hypothetical protein
MRKRVLMQFQLLKQQHDELDFLNIKFVISCTLAMIQVQDVVSAKLTFTG